MDINAMIPAVKEKGEEENLKTILENPDCRERLISAMIKGYDGTEAFSVQARKKITSVVEACFVASEAVTWTVLYCKHMHLVQ